jgi:hypothetical protein
LRGRGRVGIGWGKEGKEGKWMGNWEMKGKGEREIIGGGIGGGRDDDRSERWSEGRIVLRVGGRDFEMRKCCCC